VAGSLNIIAFCEEIGWGTVGLKFSDGESRQNCPGFFEYVDEELVLCES